MNAVEQFAGLSQDEITEQLNQECDVIKPHIYVKPFDNYELNDLKVSIADLSHEIFDLENQLAELKEPIMAQIKEKHAMMKNHNVMIKKGGYDTEENCFFMFDRSNNTAKIYAKSGDLVTVRPMTESEINEPELRLK